MESKEKIKYDCFSHIYYAKINSILAKQRRETNV